MTVELICASHSPLMSYNRLTDNLADAVNSAKSRLRTAVATLAPELVVVFGPDHFNGFFYENMPPFCIGVRAESAEDYDMPAGDLGVPEDVALDLISAVRAADIDVAVSYRMKVDHGFTQTLAELGLFGQVPTVPIFINAAATPLASCRRARLLGDAVGRFVAGLQKRVLIIGSGGLSHDPPTPRLAGADAATTRQLMAPPDDLAAAHRDRIQRVSLAAAELSQSRGQPLNPEWDEAMLDLLASGQLSDVDDFDDGWIGAQAGRGGQEIRTWIAAFAALTARGNAISVETRFYRPITDWLIGAAFVHARQAA